MQHNKYKIVPTKSPKKVAIIGAGIGGMECALVLKQRGHKPVIFEKTNELGGLFLTASAMSFKENDKELIEWYKKEVEKQGIDIRFNTEVTDLGTMRGFDEIIVATRQDLLLTVADLCSRCGLHKPVKVVLGGPTRARSVLAAAVEANPKAGLLAVHDAARPLVDPAEFDEIIRFACRTNAAAPAVPVMDTIKTADPTDGRVLSTPDRSTLFAVQTPQVMEASLLKAALQSAIDAGVELTDDCSAVERLGKEAYLATGSRENIMITTPLDLLIAEAILRGRDQ